MLIKGSKKLASVVLVTFLMTMVLPIGAFAAAKKFTDIPKDHWAKQQLLRMNLRGVINGYGDGTVKPNNSVTQFEAIIMAAGIMGLTDKDKISAVEKGAYLPVSVPVWDGSKEIAILAYQAGLIDAADFTQDKGATREWVAKLLVKVLGQESKVDGAAGEFLSYSDTSSISANYLNYIKVANSLKLLSGYEDGSFKPKNKVTRAEMAAFLARAENQMTVTGDKVALGTITSISGINLEITKSDGSKQNVYSTTNSALYDLKGKEIAVSDIALGSSVYAICTGTLLDYLEVKEASSVAEVPVVADVEGTIAKLISGKTTIIVSDKTNTLATIVVNEGTVITREGSTVALQFTDLSVNDQVKVVSKDQVATKIVVINKGTDYVLGGTIYDVDVYNNLITMNQTEGLKSYKMASAIKVSVAGMLTATASNLKAGDKASFEIVNNEMTAIAVSGSSDLYNGNATLMQINTGDKFINYKNTAGDLKANYYNTSTTVTFNGEAGKITDLQVNDLVTLEVAENVIKSIDVKNRKLSEGYKGTVYAIDTTNSILTFLDSGNNIKSYPVSTSATITLYDKSASLGSIKKDMTIEVSIASGVITNVRANNRIEGSVIAVNSANNTMEVLPDGLSIANSYNVSTGVYVNKYGTSSTRLSTVKVGDLVNVKVENNQVTAIDVTTKIDYTVTNVYSNSSSRIQVKDSGSSVKDLYIYSEVSLYVNGSSSSKVSDLKINDKLIATYNGETLVKVETSTQMAGTIESLSPTTKLVTVRGYDGKQYKYNFDSTSYVSDNGYTYNDFSKLAVGNKIAISEASDKGKSFTILKSTTAKIGLLSADLSTLLMQEGTTTTGWTEYELSSNVYLHKGTSVLKRADFPLNTMVTIYHGNNIVYEVVKQ